MSVAVRAFEPQWYLVSETSCQFTIQGERVRCHFAEQTTQPTAPPKGNTLGSPAFKTLYGGQPYQFRSVYGTALWAYPDTSGASNGALIIVDNRAGADLTEAVAESVVTAFGEQKIAEYSPIAAWAFPYNINSILTENETANGGTVTQSGSFAVLSTSTAPDGSATLRTKKSIRYQPRLSGLIAFTATFTQGVPGSTQLIGYGDDLDGFFFGFIGAEFGVLRRNAGVDNFTPIADFTDVVFDEFDPTLLNVYQIQFQWLGGGEIRFYIEDPRAGGFSLVHRIMFANTGADVSIQNPSLPIAAFVANAGNTTDIVLRTPSASGGLEGLADNESLRIPQGAAGVGAVGATELPIVTIRNPLTYQGIANRLTTRPKFVSIATAGTGNTLVRFFLTLNANLTGAVYAPIDLNNSPIEEDTSATSLTGGRFVTGTQIPIQDKFIIDLDGLGLSLQPGDTLTISAISSGSTVSCGASITMSTEV